MKEELSFLRSDKVPEEVTDQLVHSLLGLNSKIAEINSLVEEYKKVFEVSVEKLEELQAPQVKLIDYLAETCELTEAQIKRLNEFCPKPWNGELPSFAYNKSRMKELAFDKNK